MERVVWVDDDPDLLLLITRALGRQFAIETYSDARRGLEAIRSNDAGLAVVAADMNMPGMDGVEFLARVAEASPRAVRLMFTGAEDQETARKAVNEGRVFRFITKGSEVDEIHDAVADAVQEFHSKEAERRVLEDTMIGAVRALMDVVALVQPTAFGRATRIRQLVARLAADLGCKSWEIELGATLSQLGCIVLPPLVMERIAEGREVAPQYEQMFLEHPGVGAELLKKIPRLEAVAEIVRHQHKHFDGSGFPTTFEGGDTIPLGARLLKIAIDFDRLRVGGVDSSAALTRMSSRAGWYDPDVLAALTRVNDARNSRETSIACNALRQGMILMQDIRAEDGSILATSGQPVTAALALRLAANPSVDSSVVTVLAA